ncbi:MAG: hypothetical protein ACYDCN_00370 [Bacteroidia bacterium]
MSAIDIQIKQALDKAEEWIAFLATYSDARLDKKLLINRTQQVMAAEQKNEKAWEYLKIMEEIIIHARIYKEENNIPDTIDELEENVKGIETYLQLPEMRKEIFTEIDKGKAHQTIVKEEDKDQLSLF